MIARSWPRQLSKLAEIAPVAPDISFQAAKGTSLEYKQDSNDATQQLPLYALSCLNPPLEDDEVRQENKTYRKQENSSGINMAVAEQLKIAPEYNCCICYRFSLTYYN